MSGNLTNDEGDRRDEEERPDEAPADTFPAPAPLPAGGATGPVFDPIEDLPPEEQRDAPHEIVRDWRGEFPLRGG